MNTNPADSSRRVRLQRAPAVGLVPWRKWVEHALERIAAATGTRLQIEGARRSMVHADGGMSFAGLDGGTGSGGALSIQSDGTVTYGTILGVEPTIGGTPISSGPALTIPGSGTRWIVANVSGTFTTSTLTGLIYAHTMTSIAVALAVSTTDPGSAGLLSSSGSYSFVLAKVIDGVIFQNGYGPIVGGIDDILDGSGTAALNIAFTAA